jgi:hypothetical protein
MNERVKPTMDDMNAFTERVITAAEVDIEDKPNRQNQRSQTHHNSHCMSAKKKERKRKKEGNTLVMHAL